jgi:urea transport system permease protein
MTQALTYAGMLLFFRNETGFGGNNGFTGFTTLLGYSVTATTRGPRCLWSRFYCCC